MKILQITPQVKYRKLPINMYVYTESRDFIMWLESHIARKLKHRMANMPVASTGGKNILPGAKAKLKYLTLECSSSSYLLSVYKKKDTFQIWCAAGRLLKFTKKYLEVRDNECPLYEYVYISQTMMANFKRISKQQNCTEQDIFL